jgi:hypothetical protein
MPLSQRQAEISLAREHDGRTNVRFRKQSGHGRKSDVIQFECNIASPNSLKARRVSVTLLRRV